jgi:hypothetical protein
LGSAAHVAGASTFAPVPVANGGKKSFELAI